MNRILVLCLALVLVLAACGGSEDDTTPEVSELEAPEGDAEASSGASTMLGPEITPDELDALIAEADQPILLNVWASWCGPCKAEAPLLADAVEEYGDQIRFIGIDTQDNPEDGQAFIDEYGLVFEHFQDPNTEIRTHLNGIGVPLTYYITPDGEVEAHNGILDEAGLVSGIEGLLERSGA